MNQWYVITGGPSSGKTKLLTELAKRGHVTVPEAARALIDNGLERGISTEELRSDEKKFQEDVARLKQEIETSLDPSVLTFFDRGMHDTVAYMRYYGYDIEPWLDEVIRNAHYKHVFLLKPIGDYKNDYARIEDAEFAKQIQSYLAQAYTDYGMSPTVIDIDGPSEKADFILDSIAKGEL